MTQEQIENKVKEYEEETSFCDKGSNSFFDWQFTKLAELELRIEALESLNHKP